MRHGAGKRSWRPPEFAWPEKTDCGKVRSVNSPFILLSLAVLAGLRTMQAKAPAGLAMGYFRLVVNLNVP